MDAECKAEAKTKNKHAKKNVIIVIYVVAALTPQLVTSVSSYMIYIPHVYTDGIFTVLDDHIFSYRRWKLMN